MAAAATVAAVLVDADQLGLETLVEIQRPEVVAGLPLGLTAGALELGSLY
jgi:hypothetical protein